MANASIGGLVSGLDTATIINQLMQLEAQPQTRLRAKVTTEQNALTALQALNTKLAALAVKAGDLSKMTAWSASTATSDSEHVTATTDAGAAAGSLSFSVVRLATATRDSYNTTGTLSAAGVGPTGPVSITHDDGTTESFEAGDGSLQAIAAGINSGSTKLSATLVQVDTQNGEPIYRLSVSSKSTGNTSGFTIGDAATFLGGVRGGGIVGADAEIQLPGEVNTLKSATNTFDNLMPGVDVTLGAKATGDVTITVAPDTVALRDKVKAIVEAVNAAVADIDRLTNFDPATKKAGLVAGDGTLRSVRDQLLRSVIGGVDGTSLADVGIEVDRYGKLTFDAGAFDAAFAKNPTGTADLFVAKTTDAGLATGLETLAKSFSNSVDGVVTSLVKGRTSAIEGLNDAIEGWDTRLALRRTTLERQYGALEVALGKLQSQSSWLAGQINSLPSGN
jgi:flagellar hook-associated protein 2